MLVKYKGDMTDFQKETVEIIDKLFCDAFKTENDNFFIQILLGASGGFHSLNEAMMETQDLVHSMKVLIAKEKDGLNQLRIALMLYCHISETNYIPRIVYNLLLIKENQLIALPFPMVGGKYKREMSPFSKIQMIKEKSINVGEYLESILDKNLRNAFYHSDYVFNDSGIILGVERNMTSTHLTYKELDEKLNNMIFFFDVFMITWMAYKNQIYQKGDIIRGITPIENLELIIDDSNNEVIGFKSTFSEIRGNYLNRELIFEEINQDEI